MMKRYAIAGAFVVALGLLAAGPARAESKIDALDLTVSGSIGLATDYTFRGISQTQTEPALQGAIDLQHASGVYGGLFASNVDFPGADANIEIDWMAGYRFGLGPVNLDVGGVYYTYPGARSGLNLNYVELMVKGSYELPFATFLGAAAYSPDFQASSGTGIYLEAGADVKLPFEFVLGLRLGHQWIEENPKFGVPDFLNWSIGISRDVFGFTLALTYTDTDLSKRECLGGLNLCEARVIGSVTRKF